ncbi:MAG: type II toxin-antitoxin system HicB family antitoxin [Ignavibacterium album]|uniref:type II toxin-antitoxin system HicB family antitoxin n=1 Tax=Ignavibacterium album TaxID=591197 RepID=UPI0026F22461|nr:type II toxin-antitoxin system HicB family antitoxin [Ignavibacterium album]MCX8105969.1 type II toxin-antitoxin system HicB family antitoxin [Ignavibacterium album]
MKTREIDYVVWKEDNYYVSRCINVEVSSFGQTVEEAIQNLKEAVELYFDGEDKELPVINNVLIGKEVINA